MLVAGRLDEAEAIAEEILEIGMASGQPDTLTLYGSVLLSARREQGRIEEVIELLVPLAAANPNMPIVRANLAAMYMELDRSEEALGLFETDARNSFAAFRYNSGGWLLSLCMYSEVCAYLADAHAAVILHERVSPYADHVVCGGQFSGGAAHRYVGLLAQTMGDTTLADKHFADGMALNDQIDAPIWAARTALGLGEPALCET